ncbi:MAG: phosphate ABC transporter substrate-binding protein [Oscillospiraceae bacterium]
MKKLTIFMLSSVMAMSMLAGCGAKPEENKQTTDNTTPSTETSTISGKVSLNGSTSMEKVVGILDEAFMNTNPDVDVTYDPTGSSAGITAVTDGITDIGLSSRSLKESETGLTSTVIALDGIGIIVNKDNTVTDLSLEQIAKIATGEIKNWKDVGGADGPIVMIGREAGSGTRDGFETIVDVKDKVIYAQELTATGAVIAGVAANPNAIGYASIASVNDKVKLLTVNGILPTEATVLDGTYKIQRPFVLVTKEGAEQTPAVKAYIEFATSPAGGELIAKAGAVPNTK